jgi:hypothetical protein
MENPRYPHIHVKLLGENGNAYAILARTARALKVGDVSKKRRDEYLKEAMCGNFQELVQTTMKWVNCDEFVDDEFAEMVTKKAAGYVRDDFFIEDLEM